MHNKFLWLFVVILVLGLTTGIQTVHAGAAVTSTQVIVSGISNAPNNSFFNPAGNWVILNVTWNETINISNAGFAFELTNGTVAGDPAVNLSNGITIVNNNASSGNYTYINISGLTANMPYFFRVVGYQSNITGENVSTGRLRNFSIDTVFPQTLSIQAPTAGQDFVQTSPKIDFNYTAGDLQSRITCVQEINGVNNTISAGVNSSCTNITFEPITGGNNLRLWVNDSAGNKNVSVVAFTFRQSAVGGGGGGGGGGATALPGSAVTVSFGNLVTAQRKALNTAGGTPIYIIEINPAVDITEASINMQVVAFPDTPNIARKNFAHMQITPSFTNDNILGARINFKVPKSWMLENNVKEASLWRYNNGAWKEMPTVKVSEDELNVLYKSDIPGFSLFSISEASGFTASIATGQDLLTGATSGSLGIGGWDIPYLWIIVIVVVIIIFIWWRRR